jgi:hypothetical protein
MKVSNKTDKKTTETAYLTKRVIVRATRKTFIKASEKAMKTLGYVVKAENGWVVRENIDGTKEKLHKIEKVKRSSKIVFD